MITVADYILNYLVSLGIKHVFIITGGAIAFVIDAFHDRKDIEYVCVSHEQAGSMMAEAYSRMGPGIAATMVTSGPGATNLITGICCAWFDSIPVLHISGQVNQFEQKGETGVRQMGFQETDIVSIVKPITKFASQLDKAENIRYFLEKATYIAKSGRPGPVLLDIPQNLQRARINPKKLVGFAVPKEKEYKDIGKSLSKKVGKSLDLIEKAKRPVVLAGFGIRSSGAEKELYKLIKLLGFPVVTSWSGFDLLPNNCPLRVGEIGVYGNRAANFTIQNADLLLSIGSRLDTRQTGGKPETFAREAKKIIVDIDKAELDKRRGLTPDIAIQTDAKDFLRAMIYALSKNKKRIPKVSGWFEKTMEWKIKYPTVKSEYYNEKNYVNAYVFIKTLSEELRNDAVIIPDDGGHLTWAMQAFAVKKGQRLFSAFGNSPMGYAFPASIGASFALGKKEIICIDGDGSFQLNIQELQAIVYHNLPVKIFIMNNHGYGIIKQFQELYLGSRFEATGKGYSSPNFIEIAKAYGIKTVSIKNNKELRKKIKKAIEYRGSVICDVNIRDNQKIIPKLEFGKPIEDMTPYLPREEFLNNMIVKAVDSNKIKEAGV